MSSMRFCRTKLLPSANVVNGRPTDCPVKLPEIFYLTPSPHIATDGNREELPNQRINLCLYNGVQDWNGLRRTLEEDHGLEVEAKDDIVSISGYATRNDYNYDGEIRKIVARYRRVSKSFSM